jgi:hypothetical protein
VQARSCTHDPAPPTDEVPAAEVPPCDAPAATPADPPRPPRLPPLPPRENAPPLFAPEPARPPGPAFSPPPPLAACPPLVCPAPEAPTTPETPPFGPPASAAPALPEGLPPESVVGPPETPVPPAPPWLVAPSEPGGASGWPGPAQASVNTTQPIQPTLSRIGPMLDAVSPEHRVRQTSMHSRGRAGMVALTEAHVARRSAWFLRKSGSCPGSG